MVSNPCVCLTPLFRRIIESFELEGTLKGQLVQPPAVNRDTTAPSGAQSPIQPDLGCLQGWGIRHQSGQPVPVSHHPQCKNLLPYTQPKPPLFPFETISPCPITTDPKKEFVPFFPYFPALHTAPRVYYTKIQPHSNQSFQKHTPPTLRTGRGQEDEERQHL